MAIADMVFNPPTGLNDATYSPQTPANEASARSEIQGVSDQLRDYINNILKPQMVALNIPITAITDLDGANLQTIIQSIRDKLKATADGSSGADYVNATAINGLVGATVQTLLEALKTYVDTHKTSSDHDTRYYSKDQLQSITTGSSGADIIKASPINANSGNTVQAQLSWLLAQIAIAATGAIPDGSIGQEKLTYVLSTKIDIALSNTGLLSNLNTSDKSSLVNAVNEVLNNLTSDLADYATDTGTVNAYKITLNPTPTTYEIGKIYKFKATNTNTVASTFQIGTLTATSIKKNVSADLIAGDISTGQIIAVIYDGTYFQLVSPYLQSDGAWEKISTLTLVSSVQQVDFSSIISGYKFFKILYSTKGISDTYLSINFNNDVSAIYSYYDSSPHTASTSITLSSGAQYSDGMTFGEIVINNIPTEKKRTISRYCPSYSSNGITNYGTWGNNTDEINKISMYTGIGKLAIGSIFTLWGCK